jgi:5-methylcytosine-specific restriction endonuclease McrA
MSEVWLSEGGPQAHHGSFENLQVHHKIKRSQQGDDALANLVTLCAYCHMAEHGQLFYSVSAVRVCSKPKPRRK